MSDYASKVTREPGRWIVQTANMKTVFRDEQKAAAQIALLHDACLQLEHRLARIAEICEQRGARLKNPTPRDIYLIAKGETDEP